MVGSGSTFISLSLAITTTIPFLSVLRFVAVSVKPFVTLVFLYTYLSSSVRCCTFRYVSFIITYIVLLLGVVGGAVGKGTSRMFTFQYQLPPRTVFYPFLNIWVRLCTFWKPHPLDTLWAVFWETVSSLLYFVVSSPSLSGPFCPLCSRNLLSILMLKA